MGTHPIFESDFDCLTEIRPKNFNSSSWAVFTLRVSSPVTLVVFAISTKNPRSSSLRVSTTRKILSFTLENESLTSTRRRQRPTPEMLAPPLTELESFGAKSADHTVTPVPSDASSPRICHQRQWATESELCFTHQASKKKHLLLPLVYSHSYCNILRK